MICCPQWFCPWRQRIEDPGSSVLKSITNTRNHQVDCAIWSKKSRVSRKGKSICRRLCTTCVTKTATETKKYPWLRLDRMLSGHSFFFCFVLFCFFCLINLYSFGLGGRNIYPISEFGVFSLCDSLFVLEITLKVLRKLWVKWGYKLCRQKRKAWRNNYVYILSSKLTSWPMRAR